jgi:clan AA aspartic protease
MIAGVVNAALEATIRLTVAGASGEVHEIEAVIDTGLSGFLTLPSTLIAALEWPLLGRQQGLLADGNLHVLDIYAVPVIWDGRPRTVETEAVDAQPLIGMSLLLGSERRIQVANGGMVTIEAMP